AELNTLIQRTLSLFLPQARLASVNIEFQSWPKPLHVLIDSIQVQQVLLNLLQNAVDAMQNSSTTDRLISIQLAPDDMQRVRIVVTDSGPNVTPEQEDKLFSAFYTTKSSGLGMGLPISRSIIRAHGGSLEYERCANSGAVFVITLPVI
ncbi:MAG: sensor histidine kinase, partial [Pirellulaceae bacterium]